MTSGNSSDGDRRGAVLVVVFVVAIALAALVAVLFLLFRSNTESYRYQHDRTGALYAAESGARLAVHWLSEETTIPGGTLPYFMPDDSSGWIGLPGMEGKALVVIDPSNEDVGTEAIRGVEIRSRGRFRSATREVSVHYFPDVPSRYALLVDQRIPTGFFVDGRVVRGPVHCNGSIALSSVSADSSGDPYAQEISTTSDGGFSFSDAGFSTLPHPPGSSVWMRPYHTHRSGPPSWNPTASEVDFRRLNAHFRGLQGEAYRMGTALQGGGRVILDEAALRLRSSNTGPITELTLGEDRDLVYFSNGGAPVYIKSGQPTTYPLTIVATGNVYISGNLLGPGAGGGGLAIVSLGDIVVATDPAFTGTMDWSPPWDIDTAGNMRVEAYLAAPSGEFRAQSVRYPPGSLQFLVEGGILQRTMGRLGNQFNGHQLEIEYDQGLRRTMPPHFPILENWKMSSWTDDPNYEGEIADDLF